jgi:hypothetical protein
MNAILPLDRSGRRRVELDDVGVTLHSSSPYPVALPRDVAEKPFVSNERLAYPSLRLVARVRRRNPWDLATGVIFGALGAVWMAHLAGRWVAYVVSALWCLAFGVLPLARFLAGRRYLLLLAEDRAIAFPLRPWGGRRVERFLEELRSRVQAGSVRWAV